MPWLALTTFGLFTCSTFALTPSRAEVERWPVLHRAPASGKVNAQRFTAAETALLNQLGREVSQRPAYKALNKLFAPYPRNLALDKSKVLLSLVAPYRSAQPERLTVFRVSEGEPPILLLVLSADNKPLSKTAAWVIEPIGNMNICGLAEGYTLRDINADGRRELAWVYGCGDGPTGKMVLNVLDWSAGKLRLLGELDIFIVGPDENDNFAEEQATVYVQKGK